MWKLVKLLIRICYDLVFGEQITFLRYDNFSTIFQNETYTFSHVTSILRPSFKLIPYLHMTTKSLQCIDRIQSRCHFFDIYIFQIFEVSEIFSTQKQEFWVESIFLKIPLEPGSLFDTSASRYLATFFDDEILIFFISMYSTLIFDIFHHMIILLANLPVIIGWS